MIGRRWVGKVKRVDIGVDVVGDAVADHVTGGGVERVHHGVEVH